MVYLHEDLAWSLWAVPYLWNESDGKGQGVRAPGRDVLGKAGDVLQSTKMVAALIYSRKAFVGAIEPVAVTSKPKQTSMALVHPVREGCMPVSDARSSAMPAKTPSRAHGYRGY